MVIDLQEVGGTLEDAVNKSHIRLFASSSANLEVNGRREVDEAGDNDELSVESDEEFDGDEEEEDGGESDDDSEDETSGPSVVKYEGRTAPRTRQRTIASSTRLAEDSEGVEFAESDSELGSGDEQFRIPDDDEVELDDEVPEGDGAEDIDENAPRWKQGLAARATAAFNQHVGQKTYWAPSNDPCPSYTQASVDPLHRFLDFYPFSSFLSICFRIPPLQAYLLVSFQADRKDGWKSTSHPGW